MRGATGVDIRLVCPLRIYISFHGPAFRNERLPPLRRTSPERTLFLIESPNVRSCPTSRVSLAADFFVNLALYDVHILFEITKSPSLFLLLGSLKEFLARNILFGLNWISH